MIRSYDIAARDEPVEVIEALSDVVDWGEHAIGVEALWRQTKGAGVRVAVLDTGWDEHPDLLANIIDRAGFTGDDGLDSVGHGTHCAGIVGAIDNGEGVVGVAPRCSLMLYKVLPADVDGLVAAIGRCVAENADIITMSWGGGQDTTEVHDALKAAYAYGIVLVAAAGNNFHEGSDSVMFPARYPEVLAVGAVDASMHKASFSATGPALANSVAMPGVDVLSTWLNYGYARMSGTSMAAPMLAGLIALMLAKYRPPRDLVHSFVAKELAKISSHEDSFEYTGLGVPDAGKLADDVQRLDMF